VVLRLFIRQRKKMAELEVWLIVVTVIVAVLLLVMSFVLLVYYSHPDDVGQPAV